MTDDDLDPTGDDDDPGGPLTVSELIEALDALDGAARVVGVANDLSCARPVAAVDAGWLAGDAPGTVVLWLDGTLDNPGGPA